MLLGDGGGVMPPLSFTKEIGKIMQNPTELAREFWEKKCLYHIQMFEYGRYSKKEFIKNMANMGWDKETSLELMAQDDL